MSEISPLSRAKEIAKWIVTDEISLQPLRVEDITQNYVDWMNNEEIIQFTEQRFSQTTQEDVKKFIHDMANNAHSLYLGIFVSGQHIGSIKLGRINPHHKTADISYIIGDKKYWGKGVASKAIEVMTEIGFAQLGLKKITAGVYEANTGSIRVLEKNGFICEGRTRSQFIVNGQRVDGLIYGKIRPEQGR